MKWTDRIPAGSTYAQPVISLVILPTAPAAAGVEPPRRLRVDGVDLLPHLTGHADRPPHEMLYGHYRAILRGRWKLTMPAGEPAGLYDLSADVAESKDRSAEHPEVVTELTRLYARFDPELLPPRWRDLFLKDAPGPGTRREHPAQE